MTKGFTILTSFGVLPFTSSTSYPDRLLARRRAQESIPAQDEAQISFDFDDNTQGYCLGSYGLFNLQATQELFKSHVEEVDMFLQNIRVGGMYSEVAIDLLQDYAQLTRVYLPPQISGRFSDRQILQAVMFAQSEGPDRAISLQCQQAIQNSVGASMSTFNNLMGIGLSFVFPEDSAPLLDQHLDQPISSRLGLSWILLQMEENGDTFTRWIRTVLGLGEAFGEFLYFDDAYLERIASWEELALTPVSVISKYASVYLSNGQLLEDDFDNLTINGEPASDRFRFIFDQTVAVCNMPTEAPTSGPTLGPDTINKILPVVSLAGSTTASSDQIKRSWESFRDEYPSRIFCLLQPREFNGNDLQVPRSFALDPLARYKRISYDLGNPFFQSDWFDLCGFQELEGTQITRLPLLVGINETLVEASLDFYKEMVTSRIGEVVEVDRRPDLDWIQPLDRDF